MHNRGDERDILHFPTKRWGVVSVGRATKLVVASAIRKSELLSFYGKLL